LSDGAELGHVFAGITKGDFCRWAAAREEISTARMKVDEMADVPTPPSVV